MYKVNNRLLGTVTLTKIKMAQKSLPRCIKISLTYLAMFLVD
jgi:hypothetical protein